jgi:hypothetical protein
LQAYDRLEIGYDAYNCSFVPALDIGGLIWEGLEHYPTLDGGLQTLENALAEWMRAEAFE